MPGRAHQQLRRGGAARPPGRWPAGPPAAGPRGRRAAGPPGRRPAGRRPPAGPPAAGCWPAGPGGGGLSGKLTYENKNETLTKQLA